MKRTFALLFFAAFAAIGCGLSDDKVNDICAEEQEARSDIWGPNDTAQCVSCYKECGYDCTIGPTSPLSFTCP